MLAKNYLFSLHRMAVQLSRPVPEVERAIEELQIQPELSIDFRRYWDAEAYMQLDRHFGSAKEAVIHG